MYQGAALKSVLSYDLADARRGSRLFYQALIRHGPRLTVRVTLAIEQLRLRRYTTFYEGLHLQHLLYLLHKIYTFPEGINLTYGTFAEPLLQHRNV
jgi:hypothetical protein